MSSYKMRAKVLRPSYLRPELTNCQPPRSAGGCGGCGSGFFPPDNEYIDNDRKEFSIMNLFEGEIRPERLYPPEGQGTLYDPKENAEDSKIKFHQLSIIKKLPPAVQQHIISFFSKEQVAYLKHPTIRFLVVPEPIYNDPPQNQGTLYDPKQNPEDKNLEFRQLPITKLPPAVQRHILSFLSQEQIEYLKNPNKSNFFGFVYSSAFKNFSDKYIWRYEELSMIGYHAPNPDYMPRPSKKIMKVLQFKKDFEFSLQQTQKMTEEMLPMLLTTTQLPSLTYAPISTFEIESKSQTPTIKPSKHCAIL